jgi:hypothetical protein
MNAERSQGPCKLRWIAMATCLGLLAAACGGREPEAPAGAPPGGTGGTGGTTEPPGVAAPGGSEDENDKRMATAVTDGKPSAPVELRYDVPEKPQLGVPFDIVLAFTSRIAAETLDIEVVESPGLSIEGDTVARFAGVGAGEPQELTLRVRGDRNGIHYVGLVARLATQVQTEARTFSVPVVIGTAAEAQKAEPARDATGQPVESMPARED